MAVRLILRENVDHLGDRGEIVTVAPGYARNYLLPKGLALVVSEGNLKMLDQQHRVWAAREAQELGVAEAMAARVNAVELTVEKKAGESGTLYGSVTTSEIQELLAGKGIEVGRRQILPAGPIKAIGTFEVAIKIHRKVKAKIKLEVTAVETSE